MGFFLPLLYQNAGDEVRNGAFILILINAAFQPFRVRNMILGGAVLPSAGDIRGIIYGDTAGAFIVGVPLAIALGLFTPLGMYGVALARGLDEVAKLFIYSYRERKVNWHKVSEEHAATSA
jgi:Na+-driven multidrug efflux pump